MSKPQWDTIWPKLSNNQKLSIQGCIDKGQISELKEALDFWSRDLKILEHLPVKELRVIAIKMGIKDYLLKPKLMLISEIRQEETDGQEIYDEKQDNGHVSDSEDRWSDTEGDEEYAS